MAKSAKCKQAQIAEPTSQESTENILTLIPTVHPTVCAGRATAEPFKIRCTSEDFPTPEKGEIKDKEYNRSSTASRVD